MMFIVPRARAAAARASSLASATTRGIAMGGVEGDGREEGKEGRGTEKGRKGGV